MEGPGMLIWKQLYQTPASTNSLLPGGACTKAVPLIFLYHRQLPEIVNAELQGAWRPEIKGRTEHMSSMGLTVRGGLDSIETEGLQKDLCRCSCHNHQHRI